MQMIELTTERLASSIEELAALSTLSAPMIRKDIRNGQLTIKKKDHADYSSTSIARPEHRRHYLGFGKITVVCEP